MARPISKNDYDGFFSGKGKRSRAVQHALDIRKFEIELYWKRATYFWTFIGATLAGYAAVQHVDGDARKDLSVTLTCLGVVLSFAWYCANRGSKQWQENWENHVDLLEDKAIGPLYKTVVTRLAPNDFGSRWERRLVGAGDYSVTKINQILSIYVTLLFVILLVYSLAPFRCEAQVNWTYVIEVVASAAAIKAIHRFARTSSADHQWKATLREPHIQATSRDPRAGS